MIHRDTFDMELFLIFTGLVLARQLWTPWSKTKCRYVLFGSLVAKVLNWLAWVKTSRTHLTETFKCLSYCSFIFTIIYVFFYVLSHVNWKCSTCKDWFTNLLHTYFRLACVCQKSSTLLFFPPGFWPGGPAAHGPRTAAQSTLLGPRPASQFTSGARSSLEFWSASLEFWSAVFYSACSDLFSKMEEGEFWSAGRWAAGLLLAKPRILP